MSLYNITECHIEWMNQPVSQTEGPFTHISDLSVPYQSHVCSVWHKSLGKCIVNRTIHAYPALYPLIAISVSAKLSDIIWSVISLYLTVTDLIQCGVHVISLQCQ